MISSVASSTPVVLIIFNRPDLTMRVFEAIRQARPQRLFVIADGPRNSDEQARCEETRRVVESIDWPCAVERDYSSQNMGCRDRIVSGLTRVFARVEEAIILEDDCLPAGDFFPFCAELLRHYRTDDRIMHVTGTNFSPAGPVMKDSYWFSKYAHSWGWASWARAWSKLDLDLTNWNDFTTRRARELFTDPAERKHWLRKLRPFATGERRDTWDFPWQFSIWMNRGACIVPAVNLVSNIGHRSDGTHTSHESPLANLAVGTLPLPLAHPEKIMIDDAADTAQFYATVEGRRLRQRRTWRYRLCKPLRVYRKLRERFA